MKLVSENIYEKFVQDSDPIRDMGIGREHIITKWLDEMGVKRYTINNDYTIDVHGDVDLTKKDISELPEYINFRYVQRFFFIGNNPLTTLRGCPKKVNGLFSCTETSIRSLKHAPTHLKSTLFCRHCKQLSKAAISEYLKRAKKSLDPEYSYLYVESGHGRYSVHLS